MNKLKEIKVKEIVCSECEDYTKLVDCDTGEVLTSGDYYHDKIREEIYGFISGIQHVGVKVIKEEDEEFICDGCDW